MSRSALFLIISVALLFSIGLLMVFNTTAAEIIDSASTSSTHTALLKQIAYGAIGITIGLIIFKLGYQNLIRYSFPLLIGASVLLVLVFVPGIGMKINGARRWLGILGYPIGQPSEFIKILIPAAYIHWYLKEKKRIALASFLKILCWFSVPIALILFEPDNGTTLIIFILLVVLFFLSKIKMLYWALPLCVLCGLGVAAASQMPHVRSRIEVYLNPELDLRGKGHQPHQAKIAAGSGRLLGRGLGESLQKLNYLPEARSDYIAAIFAEEMGFMGIVVLIALYIVLTTSGFAIAISAKEPGAFLMAAILTFLISIQAFINLGVVSGLLPSKGMTLPFFSQGGSSLLMNFIALFLLLDISRKHE